MVYPKLSVFHAELALSFWTCFSIRDELGSWFRKPAQVKAQVYGAIPLEIAVFQAVIPKLYTEIVDATIFIDVEDDNRHRPSCGGILMNGNVNRQVVQISHCNPLPQLKVFGPSKRIPPHEKQSSPTCRRAKAAAIVNST
jgi:hypothetical protein